MGLKCGRPKWHGSPPAFLWNLYADGVPPWEAAKLCQNVIAAQEDQDIPRKAQRQFYDVPDFSRAAGASKYR